MHVDSETTTEPLPSVLAVCVNWNGREVLPALLDDLFHCAYPNLETVVVDCASEDGSAALVEGVAEVIRLSDNAGYAAAINAAIRRTQGTHGEGARPPWPDYFLVLNNDVRIPPGAVGELIDFARQQGPCVCGPQVVMETHPDRLEASWGKLAWNHVLAEFHDQKGTARGLTEAVGKPVELLLGCALLIDRRALERTGLWDETFFMYHEEVDWLYRCRRAGIPVFYCPFVRIRHLGGSSTKGFPLKKTYWIRRNTVYFLRKHGASRLQWGRWGTSLAASLMFNLLMLRWQRLRTICRGVADGFRLQTPSGA